MEGIFDYNLININDFDALSIEVILQPSTELASIQTAQSEEKKYPAKTHVHKVIKELSAPTGLIYLPGQESAEYEDTDGAMPFRQRRYFFYLCGANFPGCAVTYDIERDNLTLWIPVRKPEQIIWLGALPSIEECAAAYDVDSVQDIEGLQAYIEKMLPQESKTPLYVLHKDQRPPLLSWETSKDRVNLRDGHLIGAMDLARAVKSDYEVEQIRKANQISSEAHRYVLEKIKGLTNEAQVENLFLSKCRELGAKRQAYPVIAGSGPNSAVLHYGQNDQDFADRQLMVLDAGAEFNGYASDVTRTFPLTGEFTPEAKKIYGIVLEMQDACISMIRPEASWELITLKAKEVAVRGLLNIGILQPRLAQTPPVDVVRAFFPHGLGHLVGLDVHDVISGVKIHGFTSSRVAMSPVRLTSASRARGMGTWELQGEGGDAPAQGLKKNMVITCEPGLYFNRAYIESFFEKAPTLKAYVNMAALEDYYPVGGVRIEDCLLVIDDGYENLTSAPKGEEMIKIIKGE